MSRAEEVWEAYLEKNKKRLCLTSQPLIAEARRVFLKKFSETIQGKTPPAKANDAKLSSKLEEQAREIGTRFKVSDQQVVQYKTRLKCLQEMIKECKKRIENPTNISPQDFVFPLFEKSIMIAMNKIGRA